MNNESIPWDWADYEALWILAKRNEIDGRRYRYDRPVAAALVDCDNLLEDEEFRSAVAARIREIAG